MQKYFQDKLIVHQTKAANEPNLIYYSQVNLPTAINKLEYLKKEAKRNDLELPQKDSDISNLFYITLWLRRAVREAKRVDIKSGISSADICDKKMKKIVPEQLFLFL